MPICIILIRCGYWQVVNPFKISDAENHETGFPHFPAQYILFGLSWENPLWFSQPQSLFWCKIPLCYSDVTT